jgi:hypothetical protein
MTSANFLPFWDIRAPTFSSILGYSINAGDPGRIAITIAWFVSAYQRLLFDFYEESVSIKAAAKFSARQPGFAQPHLITVMSLFSIFHSSSYERSEKGLFHQAGLIHGHKGSIVCLAVNGFLLASAGSS